MEEPDTEQTREDSKKSYEITRLVFLRAVGFIYFAAYLSLSQQVEGLFFKNGLLPIDSFIERLRIPETLSSLLFFPSLFLFERTDSFLFLAANSGLAGSVLVMLGVSNAFLMVLLWLIYLSFVTTGQVFFGYGWDILLLETGFLSIFLCPLFAIRAGKGPRPDTGMFLLRWLLFRVMLGAGLIKIRSADPCWRDLTCLLYHYETQPIPNPLSWYFHSLPALANKAGVVFNHFIELVVPWFVFFPAKLRRAAGVLIIVFQTTLILSGNLSFLNYLTIALCIPCLDDGFWKSLGFRQRVAAERDRRTVRIQKSVTVCLALLVGILSIAPIVNLLSSRQLMNASFDPYFLVNTYGAFGTVGTERFEIVLQGTKDEEISPSTDWIDIEFKYKPGDVTRRPPIVAPYQPRVDWQIWFAAMQDIRQNPWLLNLVEKLLQGDAVAWSLLEPSPFEGTPKYIRAQLYRYIFTRPADEAKNWWRREYARAYFPPLSIREYERIPAARLEERLNP